MSLYLEIGVLKYINKFGVNALNKNSLSLQESTVVTLGDTVATRKYPFTQETLDQIQDIRHVKEKEMGEASNKNFIVPAPVVIAEAIDALHREYFQ